jgi:hypothetical protein
MYQQPNLSMSKSHGCHTDRRHAPVEMNLILVTLGSPKLSLVKPMVTEKVRGNDGPHE